MAEVFASLQRALPGRYSIECELGRGGMATVYLGQDLKHHRRVAIKVLTPDLAAALGPERFLREIEITSGLQHPHMLTLIDSGSDGGFLYYVMPYVSGESLRSRLNREKQLPIEDALQIVQEVADALSYAHSRGVLHRDVKPENILLSGGHAIVADFGIARAISVAGEGRLTQTGVSVGTPAYMSPEQATGTEQLDGRSDIYSLGCVLYEMLAGHPPFAGTTAQALIARHLIDRPPSLRTVRPAVSPALEQALEKALAKVPADRFESAVEFADAVRGGMGLTARVPWNDRRVFLAAAVFAVVLAVAVGMERFSPHGRRGASISNRQPSQLTSSGLAQGPAFAPDGKSIAYSELTSSVSALVVRDLNGGEATIFRDSGGPILGVRWSPSGSRILFRGFPDSSLSSISRLGGGRTQLLLNAGFQLEDADFGADDSSFVLAMMTRGRGQWLYVGRAPNTIHAVRVDSLEGTGMLARLMLTAEVPSWSGIASLRVSPDRRSVAVAHIAGELEVVVVALDGSRQDVVVLDSTDESVNHPGVIPVLAWPAGSDWIYYATEFGSASRISRVQIESVSGRRKGSSELMLDRLPPHLVFDVSREGRRLVYSGGWRRAAPYLWSWRPGATSRTTKLIRGTASYQAGRISPDGRLIAYLKADDFVAPGAPADLYVRPLPEGAEHLVARTVSGPIDWSPDGKRLAYFRRGLGGGLTVVDVQSGRARQLGTLFGFPSRLAWSPDGRTIAYASGGGLIVIQDTAGGPETVLPFMGRSPWLASFANPVFSPDGRKLAMFRPNGLWVLDIASRRESLLVSGLILPKQWTKDGSVYGARFDATFRTLIGIERVSASNGQSRLVVQSSSDLQSCDFLSLVLTADSKGAVCTVVERAEDIWLMDIQP